MDYQFLKAKLFYNWGPSDRWYVNIGSFRLDLLEFSYRSKTMHYDTIIKSQKYNYVLKQYHAHFRASILWVFSLIFIRDLMG